MDEFENTIFNLRYVSVQSFPGVGFGGVELKSEFVEGQGLFYLDPTSKRCCPLGSYYDATAGTCLLNPIPHCLEQSDPSTCERCEGEFDTNGDKAVCCPRGTVYDSLADPVCQEDPAKVCQEGSYLSNNFCCPKGFYFDLNIFACEKLIDPNCEESDTFTSCGVCGDGHELGNVPVVF